MAIINQQIRNGVCTISKPGQFFSLVSASGIVRVKLRKAGTTVFDSKMWVGMNLPTAIPFDDIEIYGDDAPIEIWAGMVAMNQSLVAMGGANAIRTNVVKLLGSDPLTGSDVTRTAVRLRTDKEIFVGGAGVGGEGWRLVPGQVEEVPVKGVLYGYRLLPELNMADTSVVSEHTDGVMFGGGSEQIYVSEDKTIRLQGDFSGPLRRSINGGAWEDVFNANASEFRVIKGRTPGEVFVTRIERVSGSSYNVDCYIYQSNDSGMTFTRLKSFRLSEYANIGDTNNSGYGINAWCVKNVITFSMSGCTIGFNVSSLEVKVITAGSINRINDFPNAYPTGIQGAVFLGDLNTALVVMKTGSYKPVLLIRTTDAGQSWEHITQSGKMSGKSLSVDQSGRFVCVMNESGYMYLSDNGGLSLISAGFQADGNRPHVSINLFKSHFLYKYTDTISLVHLLDGAVQQTSVELAGTGGGEVAGYLTGDGTFYTYSAGGNYNAVYSLSITGDLSPAHVEVMELLA
ncbi:hypothetical protein L2750_12800 [Shewanella submarina]|uniref:Exo-alpha-sialidase n=1 Tax=Shewanella submarina TaxID=2016376 RepID=A0ABV7GH36_9GAMM|nr:hypothetical protein [Shewanella submarina]MCL1038028.1 hypothetical protein [Shewanella submarina]